MIARGALEPAVEVAVLDLVDVDPGQAGADHWAQLEAAHVALRVGRLVRDEGWRPRDVVVLLRVTTHFAAFERALDSQGVPCYVVGGRGYYAQDEVADLFALLQLLVNPCDDAALVTVLRSPMVGLSDDALALLRLRSDTPGSRRGVVIGDDARFLWQTLVRLVQSGPDGDRADAMPEADRRALTLVWRRLEQLRRRSGRVGLAGMLEEALTLFDYDLAILRAPDGQRRFANMMKLLRMAEQYEAVEGPDLAGLLAYLRRRSDVGDKEGNAAVLAEDEDVVRVMTIHQAKGLEFPVVVVAGLGIGRRRRGSPTFLVDTQGRRAVRVGQSKAEGERGFFSLGPATALVDEQERREREEEDRLYYVAATRAEERLLLVGTRLSPGRGGRRHRRAQPRACRRRLPRASGGRAASSPGRPRPGGIRSLAGGDGCGVSVDRHDRWASCRRPRNRCSWTEPATSTGRVSFSSLHAYGECPRRYYVERVLGLRLSPETEDEGNDPVDRLEGEARGAAGRAVGVVVHRVLQSLPLDRPPGADTLDEIIRISARRPGCGDGRRAHSACPRSGARVLALPAGGAAGTGGRRAGADVRLCS